MFVIVRTPPILPPDLQSLRVLRLLRLLRLVRLASLVCRFLSLKGLRFAAVGTLVVALGGAAAFQAAEDAQGVSFGDPLWWAVATMTTVGCGDVYPQSALGRVVGVMVMLVGSSFMTGSKRSWRTDSVSRALPAHHGACPVPRRVSGRVDFASPQSSAGDLSGSRTRSDRA